MHVRLQTEEPVVAGRQVGHQLWRAERQHSSWTEEEIKTREGYYLGVRAISIRVQRFLSSLFGCTHMLHAQAREDLAHLIPHALPYSSCSF